MRKILTSLVLSLCASASAFDGVTRMDWINQRLVKSGLENKGRDSIYIFMRTDCDSCLIQLSHLANSGVELATFDVVVVSQRNSTELRQLVDPFLKKYSVIEDLEGKIVDNLSLKRLPTMLIASKSGDVKGLYEGIIPKNQLSLVIKALSESKPVPILSTPGNPGALAGVVGGVVWAKLQNNLLVFHSIQCKYCTEQVPYVADYARKNPAVNVLVIAPDQLKEVKEQFSAVGAPANIRYVLAAGDNRDKNAFDDYRITATPTHVLVNSKGSITWRSQGFNSKDNVFNKIPLHR